MLQEDATKYLYQPTQHMSVERSVIGHEILSRFLSMEACLVNHLFINIDKFKMSRYVYLAPSERHEKETLKRKTT